MFKRYAKNNLNMSGILKGLQGISHINILFQGISHINIYIHFFHNSSTRNAKKSIKPSKTSYYSLECI